MTSKAELQREIQELRDYLKEEDIEIGRLKHIIELYQEVTGLVITLKNNPTDDEFLGDITFFIPEIHADFIEAMIRSRLQDARASDRWYNMEIVTPKTVQLQRVIAAQKTEIERLKNLK